VTSSKLAFPSILALAQGDDPGCAEALARFRDPELVGELMVAVYRTQTPAARAALRPLLSEPFERGRWQGFKRIYKLAEGDHDVATWCHQALVLDRRSYGWPVSQRTIAYLQRRSYRHLKQVAERRDSLLYDYLEALLPDLEERESSSLLRRLLRADDPGFGVMSSGEGFRASEVREGPQGEQAEARDEDEVRELLAFDDTGLTKSSTDLEPVRSEGGAANDDASEESQGPVGWRGPVFPETWVQDPTRLLALLPRVQHRQTGGAVAQLLLEQAGEALWSQPLEPFYALLEHPVESVWRLALSQLAGRARQDLLRFDAITPLLTRVAASGDWPVIEDLLYVLEDERALEARASVAEDLVALARSRRDDPGVGGVVDFVQRHYPERIGPPLFDAAAALALLGARRPDVRSLGRQALERVAASGGLFPGHLEALLQTALPDDAPDLTRALLCGRETEPVLPALLDEVRPELCAQALGSAPEAGFQALRSALLAREETASAAPGPQRLLRESLPGVLVTSVERRVRRLGLDLLGGALERGELELLEVTELLRTSTEDVVVWVREALAAAAAEGRLGNEALYRMLDAVQADVRGFGRGLVQEHLARFEVAELVCFCAESPDAPTAALGLELYRERLQGEGDHDLAKLLPMFRILLFKVAQARAEKERLYLLLREWALERDENARLAVAVVAGFRRTHARIDLSRALALLAQIRVQYPEIELPFAASATFGHVLQTTGGEK
jgi:hypothetical protein